MKHRFGLTITLLGIVSGSWAVGCEPRSTRDDPEGAGRADSGAGNRGNAGRSTNGDGSGRRAESAAEWPELRKWLRGETLEIRLGERLEDSEEVAASRGALLFRQHCTDCHGEAGRGDGPRAGDFDPRPSDLTRGSFKFRSTETGSLPTTSPDCLDDPT